MRIYRTTPIHTIPAFPFELNSARAQKLQTQKLICIREVSLYTKEFTAKLMSYVQDLYIYRRTESVEDLGFLFSKIS